MENGWISFSPFVAAERNRTEADSHMQASFGMQQNQQQFLPTVQPTVQAYAQPRQNVYLPQDYGIKMPTVKDIKLHIDRSNGKEEYKGPELGVGTEDYSYWTSLARPNS